MLDEHGFTVDYVMLDGASTNRAFMNMLLGGNARAAKYITKEINNIEHQIFVIQDSKHVIKRIRNNIEASKLANRSSPGRHLTISEKPVVWEHFKTAYGFNTQSGFLIHRYLTKEHINLTSTRKMINRLAEQVLDKDMLFLMKSYQATRDDPERMSSTIDLLHNTSVPVDIFRDTRPITDPNDTHLGQLGEVLKFFSDWENSMNLCSVPMNLCSTHRQSTCLDRRQGMTLIQLYIESYFCAEHYFDKATVKHQCTSVRLSLKITFANS